MRARNKISQREAMRLRRENERLSDILYELRRRHWPGFFLRSYEVGEGMWSHIYAAQQTGNTVTVVAELDSDDKRIAKLFFTPHSKMQ